ncbi:MAG: diphosphate--fructose-6-phosphate 1-phosphotransferase [Deltaproteobacteria bacterium]|nr:diphosphate--fructose-6-phosphate 1-phosphotransferase [Deltaproteobacteria bacterium]
MTGNVLMGQSGGPTSVINASLAGLITEAKKKKYMKKIYGMHYAIEGFLQDQVVDLGAQSDEVIAGLRTTPSSGLGSCRYKLLDKDLPLVLEKLKKYDIRYLFLIGGNDSMDTVHRIEAYCQKNDYELIGVGVPKTVDNDLFGTDHTPGFGSAGRYVALSVKESGLLARDMQKVDKFVVHQCVGRDAGWLAASSALAKEKPSDAPHIILTPENDFDDKTFIAEVERVEKAYGYVYIVCGEGVHYKDGSPVSASKTRDKFSNVEFGAMGGSSVALELHKMITNKFGWRGEFQITESLPMCGEDRASKVDKEEAFKCGQEAVKLADKGVTGVMVSMVREKGDKYKIAYKTAPLSSVAIAAKPMPASMFTKNKMFVTKKYLDYASPIIGELPKFVTLDFKKK